MARWRRRSRRSDSTSEGSQARAVRNTLLNAGGSFVGVGVSILLTPFLIHQLGVEQAAVRYIAEARSAGDMRRMNSIWASSFVLLGGIALVLTPPLVLLSG